MKWKHVQKGTVYHRNGGKEMKIVRMYTGTDQKSHFEEVELSFGGERQLKSAGSAAASEARFVLAPAGYIRDWGPAPRRQYVVTLSGTWEIETGDATVRKFKPGDVMLAEDLDGQGHRIRVVGNEPHIFMAIPLTK